jgi:hypothetical protein
MALEIKLQEKMIKIILAANQWLSQVWKQGGARSPIFFLLSLVLFLLSLFFLLFFILDQKL